MDIRPDYANIEQDGKLVQIDPDEVPVGSITIVQPGKKIPVDGTAVSGAASVDASALTGESLPQEVAKGDAVISGCINMTVVLEVITTRDFVESTVTKTLALVEKSSSRKSKSENFIAKFARIYTPDVCYCALAFALLPPFLNLLLGNPGHLGHLAL